jgi:hypothetical protein
MPVWEIKTARSKPWIAWLRSVHHASAKLTILLNSLCFVATRA